MSRWLQRVWYEGGRGYWLLYPLSGLYWLLMTLRNALFRFGIKRSYRAPAPVIVVGNITAGGTGKTPVVAWLASELRQRGFKPGIVSRGYGGSHSGTSMRVDVDSDPQVVGDEPVLLARLAGCPVVVDADRTRATQMLCNEGVDVILTDDGLQHYALQRDYEICVIDGARCLGNRTLLPAGPLREPVDRLHDVDQVLVNGALQANPDCLTTVEQNAIPFELVATEVQRFNQSLARPLTGFAGKTVHGVAAIGNPGRFFSMLADHNIQVIEHPLPDHAQLRRRDLEFGDDFDVLVTEKDAVKLPALSDDKFWFVPVRLQMEHALSAPWLEQLESRLRGWSAST